MTDRDPGPTPKPGEAVAELVDSVLKLSSSVVQAVAEATTGKPQETRPGEPHLQAIIRHGTTAAGSLLSTVVRTVREQPGASDVRPSAPRVVAGGSLRLPLSIDNPGTTPMENIVPRQVPSDGPDAALILRFEPESLTIAPADFEKLVVRIAVPADMPPGRYRPAFTLSGQEASPVVLTIEVVADVAPVSPPEP